MNKGGYTHYVVFDNRTRRILWVGTCEKALLGEQESTHDGNEQHMVARELRAACRPQDLYVDEGYRVRRSSDRALVEQG